MDWSFTVPNRCAKSFPIGGFLVFFFRIRTEYEQENSECGHFSRNKRSQYFIKEESLNIIKVLYFYVCFIQLS